SPRLWHAARGSQRQAAKRGSQTGLVANRAYHAAMGGTVTAPDCAVDKAIGTRTLPPLLDWVGSRGMGNRDKKSSKSPTQAVEGAVFVRRGPDFRIRIGARLFFEPGGRGRSFCGR